MDNAGNETYSPDFAGGCSDIPLPLTVYPNPAESQAVARISVRQSITENLLIVDMNGQQVYRSGWSLQPGINQLVLPVYCLAASNYIVKLVLQDGHRLAANGRWRRWVFGAGHRGV